MSMIISNEFMVSEYVYVILNLKTSEYWGIKNEKFNMILRDRRVQYLSPKEDHDNLLLVASLLSLIPQLLEKKEFRPFFIDMYEILHHFLMKIDKTSFKDEAKQNLLTNVITLGFKTDSLGKFLTILIQNQVVQS